MAEREPVAKEVPEEAPPKTREERVAEVATEIDSAREDLAIAARRVEEALVVVDDDRQAAKARRENLSVARREMVRKRDALIATALAGADPALAPDLEPEPVPDEGDPNG